MLNNFKWYDCIIILKDESVLEFNQVKADKIKLITDKYRHLMVECYIF